MTHVDSSFAVDVLREQRRKRPGPASAWIEAHPGESLGMSIFVCCELEIGASAADDPEQERTRARDFMQTFTIVFPNGRFAVRYGALAFEMQRRGRTIGAMDTLIATTAVVERVPLLTGNQRHFDAVPGLRVLSYR